MVAIEIVRNNSFGCTSFLLETGYDMQSSSCDLKDTIDEILDKDIPCVAFGTKLDMVSGPLDLGWLESLPDTIPIFIGSGRTGQNAKECVEHVVRLIKDKQDIKKKSKEEKIKDLLSQLLSILVEEI